MLIYYFKPQTIITSQQAEIEQMKAKLKELDKITP
jgi:uncharacterized protein (DUF305 family)